jgi:hypothetical protein
MRRRLIKGESWADAFREGVFAGRIYRLGEGEHIRVDKVGSLIVGPNAVVSMETRSGHQVLKLPPLKIIRDMAELELPESVSRIRVSKA